MKLGLSLIYAVAAFVVTRELSISYNVIESVSNCFGTLAMGVTFAILYDKELYQSQEPRD